VKSLIPVFLLVAAARLAQHHFRQGPWNVDLRTPPGPEGSNGSLLRICRGHPGILFNSNFKCKIKNDCGAQTHFAFLIFNF
jgi:hypothetical protein